MYPGITLALNSSFSRDVLGQRKPIILSCTRVWIPQYFSRCFEGHKRIGRQDGEQLTFPTNSSSHQVTALCHVFMPMASMLSAPNAAPTTFFKIPTVPKKCTKSVQKVYSSVQQCKKIEIAQSVSMHCEQDTTIIWHNDENDENDENDGMQ